MINFFFFLWACLFLTGVLCQNRPGLNCDTLLTAFDSDVHKCVLISTIASERFSSFVGACLICRRRPEANAIFFYPDFNCTVINADKATTPPQRWHAGNCRRQPINCAWYGHCLPIRGYSSNRRQQHLMRYEEECDSFILYTFFFFFMLEPLFDLLKHRQISD